MGIVVGQKLWYVENVYGGRAPNCYAVVVTAIGRKWIQSKRDGERNWQTMRIHKEKLYVDGGNYSSPGQCYFSEASYKAEVLLTKKWTRLIRALEHMSRPADMTTSKIEAIWKLVFDGDMPQD